MHYEENSNENANLQQNQSRKNNVPKSAAKPKVPLTYSLVVNHKKYEVFKWLTATTFDSDILKILLVSIVEPINSQQRNLIKDEWHDVMATINYFDRIGITKAQQYCTDLMNGYREWHRSSEDTIPKQIVEKIFIPFNISHDDGQQLISILRNMSIEERSSVRSIIYHKLKGMTDFFGGKQSELFRRMTMIQRITTAEKENAKLNNELKKLKEKYEIEVFNFKNETEKKYHDAFEFEKQKFTNDEKQKIIIQVKSEIESQKQKIIDCYKLKDHHHSQVENLKSKYETELYESRKKIQKLEEELGTLTHETKSAKEETSRLQNLKSKYETELYESRDRIQELENERQITSSELNNLQYENSLKQNKIDALTDETKSAKEETLRLQNLKSKYETELQESRGLIQELEDERQITLPELSNLKYGNSQQQNKIDFLTHEIKSAKEEASRLQNLKSKYETGLQESRVRIQELEDERQITLSELKNLQYENSLNQKRIDALTHETKSAKEKVSRLQAEYETELQESRVRIQELEDERQITLSELKNLQYENSLNQKRIDALTHETKSAKEEASRLQSALGGVRDLQWNNDDTSNPLQLTKDIDRIHALLNNVTKVKPKHQIRIDESASLDLFREFKIINITEEGPYKTALSSALQRIIIDRVFDVIKALPSDINNAVSNFDENLEANVSYHFRELDFFMRKLATNRPGDDEITIIAPTKIRQQVFASLGSRGYSNHHPKVNSLTEELLQKMGKYREVLFKEQRNILKTQVTEVVVELMRLYFRLFAQEPIPEIRWIESEESICGGFMQGPWDIEASQNQVVDFCYFPAIGIDLDDDKNRRVYCKAQILVRQKKNAGVFKTIWSRLRKNDS
ncbi:8612_t:CDS:1 [Ambispora gerdemannii]|uniref:8612_t:CDS:1 n=1 Tax=Ambispora gerdemannii TaxID=144530 RepID=A0A9N8YNJ2_9GLOM|nr:8612_t:CDS:1 [Ambispora gerdemannii]